MLLTPDELEQSTPALWEAGLSAWKCAVLTGAEALLLVRFKSKSAPAAETARTILTTASSLCDTMRLLLPGRVVGICVTGKAETEQSMFDVSEVWLPARGEQGNGVLLRCESEGLLRNGALERTPDVEGRTLYLDLRHPTKRAVRRSGLAAARHANLGSPASES